MVEKSRVSPVVQYRPDIQKLIGGMSKLKERKRLDEVDKLITVKTEGSYDIFSLVELTHLGLSLAVGSSYTEEGKKILQGVDGYLARHDVLCKYLLPPVVREFESGELGELPDATKFDSLKTLSGEIDILLQRYRARYKKDQFSIDTNQIELTHLLESLPRLLEVSSEEAAVTLVFNRSAKAREARIKLRLAHQGVPLPSDKVSAAEKEEAGISEANNRKKRVVEQGFQLMSANDRLLHCPDELLDIAMIDHEQMEGYDFTRQEFGGVSLTGLLSMGNPRDRAVRTMRYLSALPKGDLFWRQIMQRVFLLPQMVQSQGGFKHADWLEGIVETQRLLGSEFFAQALYPVSGQGKSELIAAMSKFVGGLDPMTFQYFIATMINGVRFTPSTIKLLRPETDVSEYILTSDFYSRLVTAYNQAILAEGRVLKVLLVEEVIDWFIRTKQSELEHFAGIFFRNPKQRDHFRSIIADLLSQSFQESHSQFILQVLSDRIGANVLTEFDEQKQAELSTVGNSMIGKYSDQGMMGYWPSAETRSTVVFDGRSFETLLGFESISFFTPPLEEAEGENIEFLLNLQDPKVSISGHIPVNFLAGSEDLVLSVDFSQNPALTELIRIMVVSNFHDLVLRNRLMGLSSTQSGGGLQRQKRRNKEMAGGEIRIPRSGRSVLDGNLSAGEVRIGSSQLAGDIDTHSKISDQSYIPRRIDPHPVALRGAKDYQSAVREYLELRESGDSGEVLSEAGEAVRSSYEDMYHISSEKQRLLDSLPSSFRDDMRTIIDPLTGELIYLTTWVVEHVRPKPNREELSSPFKMYERFYRKGPQSRFLDSVMVKVFKD